MTEQDDMNQAAARIVSETIKRSETTISANIESAWEEWSRGVAKVDARTMVLLKAAFEAGVDVGQSKAR